MAEKKVKKEPPPPTTAASTPVIDIASSDSEGGLSSPKRRRVEDMPVVLPIGFLDPLSPAEAQPGGEQLLLPEGSVRRPKQFWKAGDYDDAAQDSSSMALSVTGIDHVRVHPRFLHSNATSHKWALGAFAELLDNAVDEVRNGAKSVNVDVIENKKVKGKMLVIEDDGGGMGPDKMRQCMSLGYSAKSKIANTIGQYGNGFKTSTMRLGADVIVFSRSNSKDRERPTQSIGLLSYTFLTSTGKEDIIVPMVDYEKDGNFWRKLNRTSLLDLQKNVDTIVQWSPFMDEDDLLQQFKSIGDQGTRIVIYNLWEDDEAKLELDFNADEHDIQIRGVNRDEKRIEMAQTYPNAKHYLTYQHSLRSYASILYLRLPAGFKMYLRGKIILHHDLVDDMMMIQEISYRPQGGVDGVPKDYNLHAVVKLGFVKDAVHHIDIQGFNVYHKNRLIKPFWRVWNAAGSDGRGVIGVLEADFVEPAHDKQGFERTIGLQRLETKLIQIQKQYWRTYCHRIGYAPRSQGKDVGDSGTKVQKGSRARGNKTVISTPTASSAKASAKSGHRLSGVGNGKQSSQSGKVLSLSNSSSDDEVLESYLRPRRSNANYKSTRQSSPCSPLHDNMTVKVAHKDKKVRLTGDSTKSSSTRNQLEAENLEVEDRQWTEESQRLDLQIERDNNRLLETKVQELEQQLEEARKEHESLIEIFSEERIRRDNIEEELRIKLKEASKTIEDLLKKVKK